MLERWRGGVVRQMAAQLAEPRGLWGRVTGAAMNVVNAEINRDALALLAPAPRHQVLEIGFGGGQTIPALLRQVPGGRVAGMELSATMVSAARKRHAGAVRDGRLELVAGDALLLPWNTQSFDRILTVNTLYFWEHPEAVLAEMRRVLRPDGRLVLGYRPKALMERLPVSAHGFRVYADEEVLSVMHAAGLEVIEMQSGGRRGREHTCVVAVPLPGA